MTRDLQFLSNFSERGFPLWFLQEYEERTLRLSKLPIRTDGPLMAPAAWQKQFRQHAAFINWGCNLLLYYTQII